MGILGWSPLHFRHHATPHDIADAMEGRIALAGLDAASRKTGHAPPSAAFMVDMAARFPDHDTRTGP